MSSNGNLFAQAGCNFLQAEGNPSFQYEHLYYVTAALFFFYSITLMLSPFNIFPTTGLWRFGWMHFHACIREDKGDEFREYNAVSGSQVMVSGVGLFSAATFLIWAGREVDDDYTFFTAAVINNAVTVFVASFIFFWLWKGEWKPITYAWLLFFVVNLVLSIVVLVKNDKDALQLSEVGVKANDGDLDEDFMQGLLWYFAAFYGLGGVQQYMTAFEAFEKFGAAMYLKEGFEHNALSRTLQRFAATQLLVQFLIFFWAAYNFGETSTTREFDFVMAIWIAFAINAFYFISEHVVFAEHDFYEPFSTAQGVLLTVGFLTAYLMLWLIDCRA